MKDKISGINHILSGNIWDKLITYQIKINMDVIDKKSSENLNELRTQTWFG